MESIQAARPDDEMKMINHKQRNSRYNLNTHKETIIVYT